MSRRKSYKKKIIEDNVNEPLVPFKSNSIQFFGSFEEMNEANAKEMAEFTPIEHLQHITEYIMHAYADELKNKITDLIIYFK